MVAIESKIYEETRRELMKDHIIIEMARTVGTDKANLVHPGSDTPRFEFTMAANAEYRARGGQGGGHIGAVAEAILRLMKEN